VHFAKITTAAATIISRQPLTLKACIFSGNSAQFGVIISQYNEYNENDIKNLGDLAAYGCTFAHNTGAFALYLQGDAGTFTLIGNVFLDNVDVDYDLDHHHVSSGDNIASSYNVYDGTEDNYAYEFSGEGDAAFPELALDETFLSNIIVTLPNPLPAGYPAEDFYGTAITSGSILGAVVIVPSGNASALASLSVSADALSPAFKGSITSYSVNVSYGTSNITISATKSSDYPDATVTGTGTKPLGVGATVFSIVVAAQNGDVIETYTITVNREMPSITELNELLTQLTAANNAQDALQTQLNTANNAKDALQTQLNTANNAKDALQGQLNTANNDKTELQTQLIACKNRSGTVVKTLHATSLQTYPNPTSGVVYIDNPDGDDAEVYTIDGTLLLRNKAATIIDLSKYAASVYIIKVGNKATKVVKE
jgi:hypothetical protein